MTQYIERNKPADPRNKLNALSNTDWMIETKSVWFARPPLSERLNELPMGDWVIETASVWFSRPPQRDKLKAQHPATFAESDIVRLIEFFTKPGQRVLDPFLGSGSTLVACAQTGRSGTGVELVEHWAEIARQRIANENSPLEQTVINGDSRKEIASFEDGAFDFVVTSPPYWMILRKDLDHKVKAERTSKGLKTRYSDEENDLGNLESYEDFLSELGTIFAECRRALKNKGYMCVVVSDFRHKSKFVAYHADISRIVESVGCTLEGITILVQDNKNLYPYGLPFAFVSNIHHQYILVFRNRC